MGDDRPTRYVEVTDDGSERVVYRASGLGGCTRALVASAQKYQPAEKPEWFQAILDQGTDFEDRIRERYEREKDVTVEDDQLEVELELGEMFGREVIVRGHIDGRSDGQSDQYSMLNEFKKFRDSTWGNFLRNGIEVNVNYPWQVSVYMLALDLDECDFTGGHVSPVLDENGEPVLDADGNPVWELVEIHTKHLAQPPFSLKAIRKRIMEIEKLIANGYDATEVECQRNQYPCPYFKLHDFDDEAWEWADDEDRATADAWMLSMYGVGEQVRQAKAALDAAEAKKKEVVKGFREFVELSGEVAVNAKKLTGDEFTVTHVTGKVAPKMVRGYELDYFKIKPNKQPKGDS